MPQNFTNVYGLPQSVVDAMRNDPYTGGGDISATKLIDAPQIVTLARKHHDQIVVDVSERIWALLGQGVHTILERAGLRAEGMIAEQRLFANVGGWEVSGQFDVMDLERRAIIDYKVTTTYKHKGSDRWTQQLNVLRWLAGQNGNPIHELEVVAIFRDWRKVEADRNPDYPRAAIQAIPVPVWSDDEVVEFIKQRVAMHQASRRGEQITCTDEDRWYSGTSYALMKIGGKRALKVEDTAEALGEFNPETHVIETRPGEYKRCAHYCEVAPFCTQWNGGKGD